MRGILKCALWPGTLAVMIASTACETGSTPPSRSPGADEEICDRNFQASSALTLGLNPVDRCAGDEAAPTIETCPEYASRDLIEVVETTFEERLAPQGDLGKLQAAKGNFSYDDVEVMKRGFLLPCQPTVKVCTTDNNPANVQTVQSLMHEDLWNELAETMLSIERGPVVPESFSYGAFLRAVARMPYFCGEKGAYDTATEACQRELAAVFAHGFQETGDGGTWGSLLANTREGGGADLNMKQYDPPPTNPNNDACNEPFVCPTNSHYFGRGLKQISYFYNYAGFSAAYYSGDFNHLLKYPDRVGCNGDLAIASGLWFHMTAQNPKPSIHDLMIGRYQPAGCADEDLCGGILYDSEHGVEDEFSVSISVVNGANECGTRRWLAEAEEWEPVGADFLLAASKRSNNYVRLLKALGASVQPREERVVGCEQLANGNAFTDHAVYRSDTEADIVPSQAGVAPKIWMLKDCTPITYQGRPPMSVIPAGLVDACLELNPPLDITGIFGTCGETTSRCGASYSDAANTCSCTTKGGQDCPVRSWEGTCPFGLKCFTDIPACE